MSAADELDEARALRHRRLRPHRRVLGLHAHDGPRVRPALPVARAAAAGGDPGAPRHLGGQRLDDAGGAGPLGRRPQGLGARPAPRALPGRDRLLEDDLGRAQRARAARDQRRRRGRQPGRGVRARRPGRPSAAPPGPTPTSSSSASRASARSAATARRCSTCCSASSRWTWAASATCSRWRRPRRPAAEPAATAPAPAAVIRAARPHPGLSRKRARDERSDPPPR